jgi:hypothetical protein
MTDIDVCPGCYAELIDLLGNKTHVGFVALAGIEREVETVRDKRRVIAIRNALEALASVQQQIHLCTEQKCLRTCEGAKLIAELG